MKTLTAGDSNREKCLSNRRAVYDLLTPAVFLLSAAAASSQQLAFDREGITAQGFEGTVQVFASADMHVWKPYRELAANARLPIPQGTNQQFYRARQKPSPAQIVFSSPTVSTGRLFKACGTATGLLVNVGGLSVTHQEMGLTNGRPGLIFCEWEYPANVLTYGTNVLTFDFLDANNNHVDTNFTVVVYPGPALTIEHPAAGSLVVGSATTLYGRADQTNGTVECDGRTVPIQEDGKFFFVGLPVNETNVVQLRSGTNVVTVSFGKSHVSFSGNISGRRATGITQPANKVIIGGRIIQPDSNGSWSIDLSMPPVRGMLPFSIQEPDGSTSSGVISSQYDPTPTGYYLTSHAISYHYSFQKSNDPLSHVWQFKTSMSSGGDVDGWYHKENYPNKTACPGVCEATYSGGRMVLWLDSEEGACDFIETRRYQGEFGIADYSDETSGKFYASDALEVQEVTSCGLHINGNSGRTFRIALKISVGSTTRDGSAGDEATRGGFASPAKVSHIGGFSTDSSGTVYFNVTEGGNYNISPSLSALNGGWLVYGFDWDEVPIQTL